jgi:hypothetical protein
VGFILDEIGNFRVKWRADSFEPEAFHTGNYKKLPSNGGVSFINKNPRCYGGLA